MTVSGTRSQLKSYQNSQINKRFSFIFVCASFVKWVLLLR